MICHIFRFYENSNNPWNIPQVPQITNMKGFPSQNAAVERLEYVPGVCWRFLRSLLSKFAYCLLGYNMGTAGILLTWTIVFSKSLASCWPLGLNRFFSLGISGPMILWIPKNKFIYIYIKYVKMLKRWIPFKHKAASHHAIHQAKICW